MPTARWPLLGLLCTALSCTAPVRTAPAALEPRPHGCWALSREILRGIPVRFPLPFSAYSLVELAEVSLGQYGSVRILGAPGLQTSEHNPNYRIHGWRPVAPDSVEVIWSMRPNAAEVRLRIRGDSARGEYFYHGDIILPGQSVKDLRRPPVPVTAVRVRCPVIPTE